MVFLLFFLEGERRRGEDSEREGARLWCFEDFRCFLDFFGLRAEDREEERDGGLLEGEEER